MPREIGAKLRVEDIHIGRRLPQWFACLSAVWCPMLRPFGVLLFAIPAVAQLTASLAPSNPTVGVTNASIVGTATAGATVTDTSDHWPDGTTHGPFSATADSSGNYSIGPFILQQLGTYTETLYDSISGSTVNINYSGAGDFSASANGGSQTVTKGGSASYTMTFGSVSGFALHGDLQQRAGVCRDGQPGGAELVADIGTHRFLVVELGAGAIEWIDEGDLHHTDSVARWTVHGQGLVLEL